MAKRVTVKDSVDHCEGRNSHHEQYCRTRTGLRACRTLETRELVFACLPHQATYRPLGRTPLNGVYNLATGPVREW